MPRLKLLVILVVLGGLLAPALTVTAGGPPDFTALIEPEDVMAHVRALAVAIGARPMGSDAEAAAADYVAAAFTGYGYEVAVQEFETEPPGASGTVTSRNVIATRPGDGAVVVVGAHLDSVSYGTGAGDNASGVAAMLAAAEVLGTVETVHTLVFVAFGAEEGGSPSGAEVYVRSLGEAVADVVAMINIDSVGVGTDLNIYAGAVIDWPADDDAPQIDGGPVWVRDLALGLARELGLPFITSPAETWDGYTGDWSDHYAFVLAGVPVAYFEAWQWAEADDPWWGQETPDGDILHTGRDVYAAVVPEKVEMTAEVVAATTATLATGRAFSGDPCD